MRLAPQTLFATSPSLVTKKFTWNPNFGPAPLVLYVKWKKIAMSREHGSPVMSSAKTLRMLVQNRWGRNREGLVVPMRGAKVMTQFNSWSVRTELVSLPEVEG